MRGGWPNCACCLLIQRARYPVATSTVHAVRRSCRTICHLMNTTTHSDPDLPPLAATPPGLYRHYKGGWYEVMDTVRCSETLQGMTLYRALYGGFGLWVRPAAMFAESGHFQGQEQARFVRHDPKSVPLADLATAQALVAYLQTQAQRNGLDTALRTPPVAPNTCCGRGCNGCVWETYFSALGVWRDEACGLLS
ncbi:MAG: hypothetical protein FD135_3677 [Comamonadaceae bacterium]|nr:MAG: hypothetical protein FD135_3677 [Comamonadaceae bacterium]